MMTFDSIVERMKNVPPERWDEVDVFLQSLIPSSPVGEDPRGILRFAGCFSDMSDDDFGEFVQLTHQVRQTLFQRKEKP